MCLVLYTANYCIKVSQYVLVCLSTRTFLCLPLHFSIHLSLSLWTSLMDMVPHCPHLVDILSKAEVLDACSTLLRRKSTDEGEWAIYTHTITYGTTIWYASVYYAIILCVCLYDDDAVTLFVQYMNYFWMERFAVELAVRMAIDAYTAKINRGGVDKPIWNIFLSLPYWLFPFLPLYKQTAKSLLYVPCMPRCWFSLFKGGSRIDCP